MVRSVSASAFSRAACFPASPSASTPRSSAERRRASGVRRSWARLSVTVFKPVTRSSMRSSMAFCEWAMVSNGPDPPWVGVRAPKWPAAINSAVRESSRTLRTEIAIKAPGASKQASATIMIASFATCNTASANAWCMELSRPTSRRMPSGSVRTAAWMASGPSLVGIAAHATLALGKTGQALRSPASKWPP